MSMRSHPLAGVIWAVVLAAGWLALFVRPVATAAGWGVIVAVGALGILAPARQDRLRAGRHAARACGDQHRRGVRGSIFPQGRLRLAGPVGRWRGGRRCGDGICRRASARVRAVEPSRESGRRFIVRLATMGHRPLVIGGGDTRHCESVANALAAWMQTLNAPAYNDDGSG